MARNVGPVQVPLAGLYGMLGVKDGSNPDVITGFVQPTVEAAPWWLRGSQEQLAAGFTANATGNVDQNVAAQMPPNEWWYVQRMTAILYCDPTTLVAGHNLRILCHDPQNQNYYVTPLLPAVVDTAGAPLYQIGPALVYLQAVLEDLWLPPQTRITVQWFGSAVTPDVLTVSPIYGARARV